MSYISETISKYTPFKASYTFDCGQAFRWNRIDENGRDWLGIVSGMLVKANDHSFEVLARGGAAKKHESIDLGWYLSLDHELDRILSSFPGDPFLDSALQQYYGLRILRQDPWECFVSFLCSIHCNIPSIIVKIENLCRRFGTRIDAGVMDGRYYSFPEPEALARAEKRELLSCRLGFRWKYIHYLSKIISTGEFDLKSLTSKSYEIASQELISEVSGKTFGVGPKVADCVCLFSLAKLEAFPIDVWMIRCLNSHYANLIQSSGKANQLTSKRYREWSNATRKHFGPNAGYAQQYLFMKMRAASLQVKGGLEGKSVR